MKEIMIPEKQKIITAQELRQKGFPQYLIRKMADSGTLTKLTKNCYENNEFQGEESDFYYVKAFVPNGVICLLSAASYYDLTNYMPEAVDVAIPRKAKVSTMPEKPLMNIHYYTDQRHELGIQTIWEDRNDFQIYDIEKTVIDIIFYREKIGIEEMKEVLTNYLQRSDRDLNKLIRYSRPMKCEKILRRYFEVLI